jgi:hypothetical protein
MLDEAQAKMRWRQWVYDVDVIDPDDERDWFDMAYGFMLALEFQADDAMRLACELLAEGLL